MVRRFWNQTCPRRHRHCHHHRHGHPRRLDRAAATPLSRLSPSPACGSGSRFAAFQAISPQPKRPSPAAPRSRQPQTPGPARGHPAWANSRPQLPRGSGRSLPSCLGRGNTHLELIPFPAPLPRQMYLLSGRALPEEGGIFIVEAAIIYSQPSGRICSDKGGSADQAESVSTAEGPLWPSPPSKRLCVFSGSSARPPNPSHLRFAQSPEFLTKT